MNPVLRTSDPADLEAEISSRGRLLWRCLEGHRPGLFDPQHWLGRVMDWALADPDFRTDLFRFVDVLPVLDASGQVAEHVHEYLLKPERDLPRSMRAVLRATERSLLAGAGAALIRRHTEHLARTFIAGAGEEDAVRQLRRLRRAGFGATVDLLGEATVSTAEGDACRRRCLALIDALADETATWEPDPALDDALHGSLPRAQMSLKATAFHPHLDPVDPAGSVSRLIKSVLPMVEHARRRGVGVTLDMEDWERHGILLDLFEALAGHPSLSDWPHLGVALQAYLRCGRRDVDRVVALARNRGTPLAVRLVKGAYWDVEVVRARRHRYECPVFLDKGETDAAYEELSAKLLAAAPHVYPAFGSHNLRSLLHAAVVAASAGLPRTAWELQMLYGMAEPERAVLRDEGYRVRVYTPVGELLPGIAYLIRRLLENSSNQGFLRLGFREGADPERLLRRPQPRPRALPVLPLVAGDLDSPFENSPPTDFTDPVPWQAFERAVGEARARLPLRVPVVVAGVEHAGGPGLERACPSEPGLCVATVAWATRAQLERAVATARDAAAEWRRRPVGERAAFLEALAERLEADRAELAALECFEAAKPWREADADVGEAVDFCRYYARRAGHELGPTDQDLRPGETNVLYYEGRGPTAVIPPWNFPLAIPCGLTAAALVAGNPVILKPAEQSSAVAFALYRRLLDVGVPPEVVQFLPGTGDEVGAGLVAHPEVAQVAFTGSREVGLSILAQARRPAPGARWIQHVVCEMGGKNAVVVDDDADLDEAVSGVVRSAFSYAGQKCSACSRCLVVGRRTFEVFTARLVEACRSLALAPAHRPECQVPPVIDAQAQARLLSVIDDPGIGAEPLYVGRAPEVGWFVPPAVFAVGDPAHRLLQEELFGPVLAVMEVADFDAALDAAVATDYALTGAIYSRHPGHVAEARARFRVGNLYVNAPCVGALVGRQPFGGFGMSGLGTKAGGPGYLQGYAVPRTVTENTVRHGFSPEVADGG